MNSKKSSLMTTNRRTLRFLVSFSWYGSDDLLRSLWLSNQEKTCLEKTVNVILYHYPASTDPPDQREPKVQKVPEVETVPLDPEDLLEETNKVLPGDLDSTL